MQIRINEPVKNHANRCRSGELGGAMGNRQPQCRQRACALLVRRMYRGLAGGLPFVARAALACVGGLTFVVHMCFWWFPALVPACISNHRVSS